MVPTVGFTTASKGKLRPQILEPLPLYTHFTHIYKLTVASAFARPPYHFMAGALVGRLSGQLLIRDLEIKLLKATQDNQLKLFL